LNEHETVPQVLVAVQVTFVVPIGKVEPDARSHATVVPRPPPTGVANVTAAPLAEVAVTLMSVGQVIRGASVTVTVNEHVASPPAFVALQFTVVVPRLKSEPEGGTQATVVPMPVPVTT
jgi:hypothetical protein